MTETDDVRFMRLALSLGRRGLGNVWPNPAVGCVVVNQGRIVGRGWTAPGGRPHAETQALAMAGTASQGATAYVTLEPCAHHGQTPPCAEALVQAGIARVVMATGDPDTRVAGRGIKILRAAGIKVDTGVCGPEARRANVGFLKARELGLPWLTLKLATSFDGRIATASGESKWITGPEARRAVHALRASHDAVLAGSGTVRADDPDLRVRDLGIAGQPVRIVAATRLDLRPGRLAESDAPLWICHGDEAEADSAKHWQTAGAELLAVKVANRQVDARAMMQALAARGLTRVFCEGGGTLAASLLSAGLVDELVGFTAGKVIGAEGTPGIGAMGLGALSESPRFTYVGSRPVGGDLMHRWAAL